MNCRDILYTTVLFVLLPMWIGYLWVELLKLKDGWSRLVHAWVMGFGTMLADGAECTFRVFVFSFAAPFKERETVWETGRKEEMADMEYRVWRACSGHDPDPGIYTGAL